MNAQPLMRPADDAEPTPGRSPRARRREIHNILLLEDIPQVRQWLKSLPASCSHRPS